MSIGPFTSEFLCPAGFKGVKPGIVNLIDLQNCLPHIPSSQGALLILPTPYHVLPSSGESLCSLGIHSPSRDALVYQPRPMNVELIGWVRFLLFPGPSQTMTWNSSGR